jgi:uncharacterized protein (DUF433 family)
MNLPEFLTETPDGEILLAGHRIDLYHVVRYYNNGFSPEMLAGQYPTLPLSLIHKVIAFYLENRGDVDTYLASCRRQLEELSERLPHVEVAELRRRMELLRQAESPTES